MTTSPCLLVCLHDQVTTSNTPCAHIAATTTPCPQPIFLYRPSSTIWLVLVASTRRLSTQRAGTRGFTSSHATPRDLTRARKHAPTTHLSIAHFTTPPPPSSILHLQLCSSSQLHHYRSTTAVLHSLSTALSQTLLHHLPTRHPPTPTVCHHSTISLAITAYPLANQDR